MRPRRAIGEREHAALDHRRLVEARADGTRNQVVVGQRAVINLVDQKDIDRL